MPQDLQIRWNGRVAELIYENGDFVMGDSLDPSLNIAIFTQARVPLELARNPRDRRGWILGAIGSRIWARLSNKKNTLTLREIEHDVYEATRPLVRSGIIESITAIAEYLNSSRESVLLRLSIETPEGTFERTVIMESDAESETEG